MIITNIIGLENRGLLRYQEAGDMFQAILLSLDRLPLSIFFNTGPRQDQNGNHQNRWGPTKIDADTLASHGPFLKVHHSFLWFEYSDRDSGQQILVYTVDTIIQLGSEIDLHSESEGILFTVNSRVSGTNSLDTRGHA